MDQVIDILHALTSNYFYILTVAIGYWKSIHKRLFIDLTFLLSFTTIVNCLLKNIFAEELSNIETHLISVHDMKGFPSGDVQMASLFWGLLAINYKSKGLQIFGIILVSLIGLSRVFSGVHSAIDVVGGMIFAIATIIIWNSDRVVNIANEWVHGNTKSFWVLIAFTMILFTIISSRAPTPPAVVMSLGLLIGLGIFLATTKNSTQHYNNEWVGIILSLIILAACTIWIPIINYNAITTWITIIFKYGFIAYIGVAVLPKLQIYIKNKLV